MAFPRLTRGAGAGAKQSDGDATGSSRATKATRSKSESSKLQRPKILLLDLDETVEKALGETWADVVSASLGTPYKVKRDSGFQQVIQPDVLYGHEEVDLVAVDLSMRDIAETSAGQPHKPRGEIDLWAKCDKGYIDSRVRTVVSESIAFERISSGGGVFVVFASVRSQMDFCMARASSGGLYDQTPIDRDVWALTQDLGHMQVDADAGENINVVDTSPVGTVLAKYLAGARFECTLRSNFMMRAAWSPLAVNKYGSPVGMMGQGEKGFTIVVPQLADKAGFLKELLAVALPEIAPHLFPDLEQSAWTRRADYELSRVVELQAEKDRIVAKAKADIASLDEEIKRDRAANAWLHDLLTGTGQPLELAIEKAFYEVGFKRITNVDELRDAEGKSRREDLRVEDKSPMLVVDIKGIGGYPSDEDATQANKHALINTKELGRTDIQGLSIINHQRLMPPLDRENNMPFRQELLDVAGETGLGLMTAFDVYRLIVNMRKHGWPAEQVKPVFYRSHRIECVPVHYRYLGIVAVALTGKFGVVLTENSITVGEGIAVEGPIYFDETEVKSIHIDDRSAETANVGDRAGFLWPAEKLKIRVGMRVFAISKLD